MICYIIFPNEDSENPQIHRASAFIFWEKIGVKLLGIRIQLLDMGLESHIGSMGFGQGICKAFGSPITIVSFYDVVLLRFYS